MQSYYKFLMYRNPIERLFSGYRSKVQRTPLIGLSRDYPHYNWLKKEIFKFKHPEKFHQWHLAKGKRPVNVTFSDFIDYWLNKRGLNDDEHFQSIYSLCQPCQVHYSYYGNFNAFKHDAEVLIGHIEAEGSLLRDGYYEEGEHTSDLAPRYYQKLSRHQKEMIISRLALDLSFYYTIFPLERDIHKVIMDIDFDVPKYQY